jgi:hypothetical protein
MFSILRRHFTYTNMVLTVALVFAMSGGAYAAGKYLITSTKQIKPSVLKTLKGATGKSGPAGPAGSPGPAGATGAKGENGKEGQQGKEGAPGVEGKAGASVTSTKLAQGNATCKEGGSEFAAAEGKKTYACNGSPWTAGGVLPKGASERGQWAVSANGTTAALILGNVSFSVPLAAALGAGEVHFIGKEEGSKEANEAAAIKNGECTGTWEGPGAESGNLCVFLNPKSGSGTEDFAILDGESAGEGAGVSGAVVRGIDLGSEPFYHFGSWVVTG